jgi:hypothetical protein
MRHRPPRGTGQLPRDTGQLPRDTGQLTDLEQKRRLLDDLSALCAQDGVAVESAAPDAVRGVSPRLLAATRAGSPAGEPILLRGRGGREVIAVVDGRGQPRDIWEAIRVRAGTPVVRRRLVEPDDLPPGLTAIAVRSDGEIAVFVAAALPARLQRAGGRSAMRAAGRAGWTRNRVPAASLLFTGASIWRATLASGARRFAAAGSAALIIAVIISVGLVLARPQHSAPVRAIITPVTPSSTPHVRGTSKQAARLPRHVHTARHGRARVVTHRQPVRTARPGGTPTAVTSRPAGSSQSPDPSPSPSPTKTKHCIILLIC